MASSVPNIEEVGVKAPPPLAQQLRREVAGLLGRNNDHFPGAQPVSFSRKHLRELKSRDYFVCEKSDGIRSLLYFTADSPPSGAEILYLIDRRNDYYHVPSLHFPRPGATKGDPPRWDTFHKDTLLDGELLFDTDKDTGSRKMKYLVFDCLVLDGHNLCGNTLDKRLAHFHEHILEPYQKLWAAFPEDCEENFRFRVERKSTQRGYGIEMMFKQVIPDLRHGSDGLIFTCRETPYRFGTDECILKWKPKEENSVDFKLDLRWEGSGKNGGVPVRGDGVDYDALPTMKLLIYLGDGRSGPDKEFATLVATREEWDMMKRWAVERQDGLDGQIVECHQDASGNWRFNRFRDDKAEANHVSTVEKVVESIEDGVGKEELLDAAYGIRKAWKEREQMAAQKKR